MGMLDHFLRFNSSSKLAYSFKSSLVSALLCFLLILQTTVKAEEQDELNTKYCREFIPPPNSVQNNFLTPDCQIEDLAFGRARYEGGESLFNNSAYIWNPKSRAEGSRCIWIREVLGSPLEGLPCLKLGRDLVMLL